MSIHDYLVDEKYVLNKGEWYVGNTMYIPNDDIDGAIRAAIKVESGISGYDDINWVDFKIIEEPYYTERWKSVLSKSMVDMLVGYRPDGGGIECGGLNGIDGMYIRYIIDTKFGSYGSNIAGLYKDDVLNNGVIGKFVASFISSEDN